MLRFFEKFPEIIAVMSEKEDGSMKLLERETLGEKNLQNREAFLRKNGIGIENVVSARLVHGNKVKVVSENDAGKVIEDVDGLVTKNAKTFLAVTIADCVPVFFYENKKKITALAHVGWKGTVGNIIKNMIEKIIEAGGNTENIYVALGPGINECHFEIKEDLLEKFSEYREFILRRDGKIFADLKGIIKKQLFDLDIKEGNIENNSACTYCSENLFSSRRDKTNPIEAMIAAIGFLGK